MNTATRALAPFRVVLLGIACAWVLFVLGVYYLYDDVDRYAGEEWVETFNTSVYLFLAAVVVGGGSALWSKRRSQKLLDPPSAVAISVQQHSTAILIAATVAGAWALFVVFVNLLITDHTDVTLRIVNTYVPIVLFTIVVVFFLLAAFVFDRPAHRPPHPVATPAAPSSPESTRANALAYAVPIIAGAVAAITAGIVYDVTGTALTAWLWAIVFALVAAGILAGTHFASSPAGSSGASGLNFAWVIAFAVVSLATAFGYGASSVDKLHLDAMITMEAYDHGERVILTANGSELLPGAEVVVTAGTDDAPVTTFTVDSGGWFFDEVNITSQLIDGAREVSVSAPIPDGGTLTATLPLEFEDGALVMVDDGVYTQATTPLPVPAGWFVKDLLPGFVILLTGLAVMHLTIPMRARRHPISQNG